MRREEITRRKATRRSRRGEPSEGAREETGVGGWVEGTGGEGSSGVSLEWLSGPARGEADDKAPRVPHVFPRMPLPVPARVVVRGPCGAEVREREIGARRGVRLKRCHKGQGPRGQNGETALLLPDSGRPRSVSPPRAARPARLGPRRAALHVGASGTRGPHGGGGRGPHGVGGE